MEQVISKTEELMCHLKEYADNRITAAKLSAAEKAAKVISSFISTLIIAALIIFFLFFSGMSLALALSKWTHDPSMGYLLVATLYLIMAILAFIIKQRIFQLPIMNSLLQQLFNSSGKNGKDQNHKTAR